MNPSWCNWMRLIVRNTNIYGLGVGSGPRRAIGRAPDSCQRSLVRYLVWTHTFVSPLTDSRKAVVSYWRKCVHKVLVSRLGGLRLPRKSVVRLTDCHNMTLDAYCGHKTTTQQQQQRGGDLNGF